jgi:hypothetical protein
MDDERQRAARAQKAARSAGSRGVWNGGPEHASGRVLRIRGRVLLEIPIATNLLHVQS